VDELLKKKHKVFVVDDLSVGKKEFLNSHAKFAKMKIQAPQLLKLFRKESFEYVYHLAAQKNLQYSKEHPVEDAETNIVGSLRVIEAAKKFNVRKIIFYSTAAVYNPDSTPPNKESDTLQPITPYGIAKSVIESYLQISRLSYTVLRLSNVYGPRQDADGEGGVIAVFCKKLANKKPPQIYNTGRQTRDYIYVADVVKASLRSMTKGNNEILNISTGKETTVNSLYKTLAHLSNTHITAIRGKKVTEQIRSSLANTKAKNILTWSPSINLNLGLQKTYNWFIEQTWQT